MGGVRTKRLTSGDRDLARTVFSLMAEVFEEKGQPLTDRYVDRLLQRSDFWAIAAFVDAVIVGGITAHTLPLTRAESSEIFIYDIAIRPDHQRKGVGRRLIAALREEAAAVGVTALFVLADNEDEHALDFYRALGAAPTPATVFSLSC
jgi:aminoglycoside 3-N-acetyltransferase I